MSAIERGNAVFYTKCYLFFKPGSFKVAQGYFFNSNI